MIKIEENCKARVTDDKSGRTTEREFTLISTPNGIGYNEALIAFGDYVRNNNLTGVYNNLVRFELEENEESNQRVYAARLSWGDAGGGGGPILPVQVIDILSETFSTEGATERVTQGITEDRYPCASAVTIPNFGGGIGWNGETFEGVEKVVPSFTFSLEKTYDYDLVTALTKTRWANKTGCVNSDDFHGFEAGTVLFMGVSGSTLVESGDDTTVIDNVLYKATKAYYKCTFKFQCRPNVNNLNVAGVSFYKRGWYYYWVLREMADVDNRTIKKPLGVYVNKIYEETTFSDLM